MRRRNRSGLRAGEVRIQGQIALKVTALNGTRIAYIMGLTAAERSEIAQLVKKVMRSEYGRALSGLKIKLNRGWAGHAKSSAAEIAVGVGKYCLSGGERVLGDHYRSTLLHEMAHVINRARCFRGCSRGAACGCVHNLEFHKIAFALYAKFLNAEEASEARYQEYGYHTAIARQAAKLFRKGAEFREWQRA